MVHERLRWETRRDSAPGWVGYFRYNVTIPLQVRGWGYICGLWYAVSGMYGPGGTGAELNGFQSVEDRYGNVCGRSLPLVAILRLQEWLENDCAILEVVGYDIDEVALFHEILD